MTHGCIGSHSANVFEGQLVWQAPRESEPNVQLVTFKVTVKQHCSPFLQSAGESHARVVNELQSLGLLQVHFSEPALPQQSPFTSHRVASQATPGVRPV